MGHIIVPKKRNVTTHMVHILVTVKKDTQGMASNVQVCSQHRAISLNMSEFNALYLMTDD